MLRYIFAVSLLLLLWGCQQSTNQPSSSSLILQDNENSSQFYSGELITIDDLQETLSAYIPEIDVNKHGLVKEGLKYETGTVQRYDNLARILDRYDISRRQVHDLANASDGVFNLNRFKRGDSYKLYYRETDGEKRPVGLVYNESPQDFVTFHLENGAKVTRGELPVETKTREASGIISHSLYRTFQELDLHRQLVLNLSEIFAWQVDFFRINQGDNFKVVFEEKYIDDELVGIGEVHSAIFEHRGNDYHAFRFEQNGKADYFDEEGNSLRKEFLRSPLEYRRISSRFSNRRVHPVTGQARPHHGVDYAAPTGTPIYAVGDGVIEDATYTRGNGNYVKIRHNSTYTTMYLHMSRIASGIRPGVEVEQREVIGYVGATGLATGPHVCFRFYRNGGPVNPLQVEMPPTEPVEEENKEKFFEVRDKQLEKLKKVGVPQAMSEQEEDKSS